MIGSFGKVVFFASAEAMRTFDGFTRNSSSRWAKHDVLLLKPVSQFIGPGLDTITFSMRFDIRHGMNPRKEMNTLLEMERSGKVETLIIGGVPLGVFKWKITNLSQKWTQLDGKGNLLVGGLDVTLEEYV